jgi:1-acyl-sn-glycerol-3-phosphate acyltransferase
MAETWSAWLVRAIGLMQGIKWDVEGLEALRRDQSYLLIANHQSWVDIVVLQYICTRRIPFPRYFAKRELIWLPLIGGALWALDFPLMQRFSKKFLEKHPELRGKDLETARVACERYQGMPVTVTIFVEGTRFRDYKHSAQESPYCHLLRPRAGGLAFVLDVMGKHFATLLDVTIVYPDGRPGFWDFLSGRVSRVIVRLQQREIPKDLLGGNYLENKTHRDRIQSLVREVWREKDALIKRLLARSVP